MAGTQDGQKEILQRVIQCFRTGTTTSPFLASELDDTDAYAVQYELVERLKLQGESVRGHKVALTTQAARVHLGVDEPCFGHILSGRVFPNGAEVPLAEFADPHCEAEIAFVLKEDLKGPGVTSDQVMSAIQAVLPAIELVDLKIQGDGIHAADVIAHQALHGGVIIGSRLIDPATLDLQYEGVTVEYNGRLAGSGTGSEVMGNPINPIVWLANKIAEFDDYLKAGEIVISGSVVTPVRVQPGSQIKMVFTRLGGVGATFI
jgi:2-keto-4-pentenoate hydratase